MTKKDKYTKFHKGRCNPCPYARGVGSYSGYSFLGCYHKPYTGKCVAEIKDCPKKASNL